MKNKIAISLLGLTLFYVQANALESLSYSGRLVQANGAPVVGPVNLRAELVYTNNLSTVLCSDDIAGVVLSKGVFHIKLDFACTGGKTLAQILSQAPTNESVAIQITDVTNSKSYSFQALHALPYASVASQLSQMGAADGEFLKWDNTAKEWKPGTVSGASGGTVTNVTVSSPLNVSTPTSTPAISIDQADATTSGYLSSADWNAFNSKQGTIAAGTTAQYFRGDKTWQTLDTSVVPENTNLYFTNARALGVPLTGFSTATGAVVATDSVLAAVGKLQGQINLKLDSASFIDWTASGVQTIDPSRLNLGVANANKVVVTDAGGFVVTSGTTSTEVGYLSGATSSIQTQLNNKQATITSATNLTSATLTAGEVRLNELPANGTEYTGFKSPNALTANVIYTLPTADGSNGQVLTTNSTGGLSWTSIPTALAPNGSAGGDLTGTYPNPTISALNATKIATGAIDNTEFNYLDGVTSSIQAQLTGKQTSDATLSALAAYNTNGILVQSAADTFVGRSIIGTANRTTITNGDGVSGNPTINIDTGLLPSPSGAGSWLKSTGANTSAWTALSSADITGALGFTPINKVGDTMATGTFNFNGAAVIRTLDPIAGTDVATKQYVDANDLWTKSGSDIYRASNVGIGTSTPSYPLDVNGVVNSANTFSIQGNKSFLTYYGAGSQTVIGNNTADWDNTVRIGTDTQFWNGGSARMIILNSGNVGIGTTTPLSKLHVNGGTIAVGGTNPGTWSTNGSDIFLNTGVASSAVYLRPNGDSSVVSQYVAHTSFGHQFYGSAGTEVVRIGTTGSVGIGTTSPQSKLHVSGGEVQLGSSGAACTAANEGAQRYNSTTKRMDFCDGTSWQSLGTPAGEIAAYSQATCPGGWLAANGALVSRTTYAALFSAISTMYGVGDGSTTFKLPDYRGYFLRGWNNGAGTDPNAGTRTNRGDGTTGDVVGSVQADVYGSHNHGVNDPGHRHDQATMDGINGGNREVPQSSPYGIDYGDGLGAVPTNYASTGISIQANGGSETRPKNINVLYCVKY